MNTPQKIKLNLGFAELVIEVCYSDCSVPEVCITLDNDKNMQDIACVRQATNDNDEKQEAVEVLVYSDKDNEDYTHKFTIGKHSDWEE